MDVKAKVIALFSHVNDDQSIHNCQTEIRAVAFISAIISLTLRFSGPMIEKPDRFVRRTYDFRLGSRAR